MIRICIYSLFNENKALLELEREFVKRTQNDVKFEFKNSYTEAKVLEAKSKEKNTFFIALDEKGESFTSQEFANFFNKKLINGTSSFSFILGEAKGLSKELKEACNKNISLSKFTFTSSVARFLLVEQIYRTISIIKGHPYHKE